MKKDNALEFAISDAAEMRALVVLIAQLNRESIPYALRKDAVTVELTISTGF